MPARRLPQSDHARQKALQQASAQIKSLRDAGLPVAISNETQRALARLQPAWAKALRHRESTLVLRHEAVTDAEGLSEKLRTYIRHYIRGMNMAIERGVAPIGMRGLLGLDLKQKSLPPLKSNRSLLLWGKRVSDLQGHTFQINGDAFVMSNPSTPEVADIYRQFKEAMKTLTVARDAYDHAQEAVAILRDEINELIRDIWDEIDFTLRKQPASSRRRVAREYGVTYRETHTATTSESPPLDADSVSDHKHLKHLEPHGHGDDHVHHVRHGHRVHPYHDEAVELQDLPADLLRRFSEKYQSKDLSAAPSSVEDARVASSGRQLSQTRSTCHNHHHHHDRIKSVNVLE